MLIPAPRSPTMLHVDGSLTRPPHAKQHKIKREQYTLLFRVADRQGKGRINMSDWAYFENILTKPDPSTRSPFGYSMSSASAPSNMNTSENCMS